MDILLRLIHMIYLEILKGTNHFVFSFRCISFHPEGGGLFSGSGDSLRVHGWEPSRVYDNLVMGWGKVKDLAISSSQLVRRIDL